MRHGWFSGAIFGANHRLGGESFVVGSCVVLLGGGAGACPGGNVTGMDLLGGGELDACCVSTCAWMVRGGSAGGDSGCDLGGGAPMTCFGFVGMALCGGGDSCGFSCVIGGGCKNGCCGFVGDDGGVGSSSPSSSLPEV